MTDDVAPGTPVCTSCVSAVLDLLHAFVSTASAVLVDCFRRNVVDTQQCICSCAYDAACRLARQVVSPTLCEKFHY